MGGVVKSPHPGLYCLTSGAAATLHYPPRYHQQRTFFSNVFGGDKILIMERVLEYLMVNISNYFVIILNMRQLLKVVLLFTFILMVRNLRFAISVSD